jgi:hypothetical protein
LALIAGSGSFVAVSGAAVALQGTVLRTPRTPLRVLDPVGFSVVAAVADRFCPATADLPSAWDLEVPEKVDAFLAAQLPGVGAELAPALLLVENGLVGLLLDGRARPFTTCDAATQDQALRAWKNSSLTVRRTAFKALRQLCSAPYWANPRVWAHTGYPGPPDFGALGAR